MSLDAVLHETACRAACVANGLDPDEVISHPYKKGIAEPRRRRWEWLIDLCPEIPAIIQVTREYDSGKN